MGGVADAEIEEEGKKGREKGEGKKGGKKGRRKKEKKGRKINLIEEYKKEPYRNYYL